MKIGVPLLLLAAALYAQTVLTNREFGRVKFKTVRIAGPFSVQDLERPCRRELKNAQSAKIFRLLILGELGGLPLPKPLSAYKYQYWLDFYEKSRRLPNELAELVAVGNNAVLRVRDRTGAVSKRVLMGRDPLRFEILGQGFEVLHMEFIDTSPSSRQQRVNIYLRTKAELKQQYGLRVLALIRNWFEELEVYAYIRNDGWFIYESGYPFANPFEENGEPILEVDHQETRTLRCGPWAAEASCLLE